MEPWVGPVVGGGLVLLLIGLFIGSYLLNKRTPKPEGCVSPENECKLCGVVSCSHHPINNETPKEEEKNVD